MTGQSSASSFGAVRAAPAHGRAMINPPYVSYPGQTCGGGVKGDADLLRRGGTAVAPIVEVVEGCDGDLDPPVVLVAAYGGAPAQELEFGRRFARRLAEEQ